MPIIKSSNMPTSVIPFSMRDIEQYARSLIVKSREQAEALLAGAQEEANAIKQAAHADGYSEGREAGLVAGTEEGHKAGHAQALSENKASLTNVVKSLTTAMKEINDHRRRLETEALTEVVTLATAIARRVTKRQGLLDADVLQSNIAEILKMVVHANDLRIAVHPSQRATLLTELPRLQLTWPVLAHAELIDDVTLAPGGCKVFTRGGLVNADLDLQLDRVIDELLPKRLDVPSEVSATT